jgi:hypothetical protein
MIEIISSYIAIWLPSLVSIVSLIGVVLTALSKTKTAINELKQDKTFKDLGTQLKANMEQNNEIKEQYDIIIDELTKIKDYRENSKCQESIEP